MNVAFFGDIHGRVYHLLAAIITWQKLNATPLDMVIQVGDFGVEHVEHMMCNIEVFLRYPAQQPAQFDFLRILHAGNQLADHLKELRSHLQRPILFLRGDHDEVDWLREFELGKQGETVPVDPFDLFHYVPDGTLLRYCGMTFAFFGGVERPGRGKEGSEHDPLALQKLLLHQPGEIDVLLTHEPAYGSGTGFYGQVQGSAQVSKLIEVLQPRYHLAGHLHTMRGPQQYGRTTSFGLNQLGSLDRLKPRVYDPTRMVQQGTMAVLQIETDTLTFVTGDYLPAFNQECETLVETLATCLY